MLLTQSMEMLRPCGPLNDVTAILLLQKLDPFVVGIPLS